jgi:signal transduction histidine kinase/ActR/RegA family two-component response regulator
MVTGREDLASIDQAYEAGANDFVTKPVTWTVFCQRIRYMLRASDAFARVREAQRAAEAANTAKRLFLARASHELRTPLHVILGFLEVLESTILGSIDARDAPSTAPEESIQLIRGSARHLLRLVDDLLDISRIEAGGLRLEVGRFAIAKVVDDLRAALLPSARRQSVELLSRNDPNIESLVSDPTRVRQILTNLVVNAIRCSPGGRVELLTNSLGAGGVEFEVRDTGMGMTPEQLQQAFEPFTQGENPSSQGQAGLGLTLVRELTRALGGSLSASSEPGGGTRVKVRLPPLAPPNERPDADGVQSSAENGDLAILRSSRVLVVDDGPDNRRLLDVVLRKSGVEVALACDGRESVSRGLDALHAGEPFDVVLMDLQMPHLDGLQAMLELRRSGYTHPIVALTANAVEGERERSLSQGFDGFLTKPITPGQLLRSVAAWVAKAREV